MIIFERIRWKNFLSTGDRFTEVELNVNHSTLIVGDNGSGKSTILDALTFGLFGKSFRKINKPQLVNSVNNKDCVIEIEFTIGDNEYKVIRSIKPNNFRLYINDILLDQDSKIKDSQKYLECNILKLNYKSFTQTVLLGSATFIPFMQLNTSDRRDIIEDILNIKIFSIMNENVKVKSSECKVELLDVSGRIDLLEQKISLQEGYIKDTERNTDDIIKRNDNKILTYNLNIKEYVDKIKENEIKIDNISDDVLDITELKTRKVAIDKIRYKLENITRTKVDMIEWFHNNDECPSCKQNICSEYKEFMVSDCDTKVDKINSSLSEVVLECERISKNIESVVLVEREISEYKLIITECNWNIDHINNNITTIQNETETMQNDNISINGLYDDLESYTHEYDDYVERKRELLEDRHYYDIVSRILNDDGVKNSIIRYYLPLINNYINKYLREMNFYVNFQLDEKFNETINSRNRDKFTYSSFSEGERMRIDLALLFTWRDIARMKNSVNTNLLILDEVFDSSLDFNGTEDFLRLIGFFVDHNIFIISHKGDILYDKFKNIISYKKVGNFSIMNNT